MKPRAQEYQTQGQEEEQPPPDWTQVDEKKVCLCVARWPLHSSPIASVVAMIVFSRNSLKNLLLENVSVPRWCIGSDVWVTQLSGNDAPLLTQLSPIHTDFQLASL